MYYSELTVRSFIGILMYFGTIQCRADMDAVIKDLNIGYVPNAAGAVLESLLYAV